MKKELREKIFNKYGGKCAYCGCELNDKWQVDHGISKHDAKYYTENYNVDCFENLMPACVPCNHYKRSHSIDDMSKSDVGFRRYMSKFHLRLGKLPKITVRKQTEKRKIYMQIIADKYKITPTTPFNGIFYFESLNPDKR